MLGLLQQNPIIVDVGQKADATPDISLEFVVGMFSMAGVFLLVAVVGSLLVAAGIILSKRWRPPSASAGELTHTRLRIDDANSTK